MAADEIRITFTCKKCGGNTLSLPDEPTDNSIVSCSSCGVEVGRWGDIQAAALGAAKDKVEKDLTDVLREAFKGVEGFKIE